MLKIAVLGIGGCDTVVYESSAQDSFLMYDMCACVCDNIESVTEQHQEEAEWKSIKREKKLHSTCVCECVLQRRMLKLSK